MKMLNITLLLLAAVFLQACNAQGEKSQAAGAVDAATVELDSYERRLSYAAAFDFHKQITSNEMPLDMEAFLLGLEDAFGSIEPRLSEEQMKDDVKMWMADLRKRKPPPEITIVRNDTPEGYANVEEQGTFLSEHMMQPGVTTLPSGLQIVVMREGEGPRPGVLDSVIVDYKGWLTDGTVFDSTYEKGIPATFKLVNVIPGWTQALKMMPVGSKWKLVIPPHLAYGDGGKGDKIPGRSVLIFELELLDIIKWEDPDQAG